MGYLDAYGAGVDRRLRLVKWGILGAILVLIVAMVAYFKLRDRSQHLKVDAFLEHLRAHDYKGAYALWGCTDANPCKDYRFEKFMEDWGPNSPYSKADNARIAAKHSCDTGVIEVLRYPGQPDVNLWVDRQTDTVGFAPWALKEIPPEARSRFAAWMWELTRNCKPLIGP